VRASLAPHAAQRAPYDTRLLGSPEKSLLNRNLYLFKI
jgi:hypothetical protein